MAQRGCDADEAFAHLRRVSQRQQRKLREVAHGLIEEASAGHHEEEQPAGP